MKVFWMALGLAVLVGLAGCARSRTLIILLPDADGQVGTIHVETRQGAVDVNQPFYAVAAGYDNAGQSPRLMNKQDIEARFDRAMAAQPPQRFRFKKQTFYFRKDTTEFTSDSKARWPEAIRQLIADAPVEIYVVGHADRVGTERYNWHLSQKRALTVKQELIASGVNASVILVSFLGESKPQIDTPDEVDEPRNRRVELILKYNESV